MSVGWFLFLIFGISLVIIAFFLKSGVFPFHWWVIDVYDGAPMGFVSFLLVFPKIFFSFIFIKLCFVLFKFLSVYYVYFFFFIGGLGSVVAGTALALVQTRVKRFLAASGIANFGFFLVSVGLSDLSTFTNFYCSVFFLIIYLFSLLGFLGILNDLTMCRFGDLFNSRTNFIIFISSLRNLGFINPTLAFITAIFFVSFAGIPPFGGFFGKLYIFYSVLLNPYWFFFSFILVLCSIVSCFYYLRFVQVLFFNNLSTSVGNFSVPDSLTFVGVFVCLFCGPFFPVVALLCGYDYNFVEALGLLVYNSNYVSIFVGC